MIDIFKIEYLNKLDAQSMNIIGMMEDQLKNMKFMINGILEYAEVKGNTKQIEDVNLNLLLPQVIRMVAIPSNIKINIATNLPTIRIEKVLIQQIFQNLISNALKYMDKENGEINIGYTSDSNYYIFYVKDNGPGIDKKYHQKIFELFKTAGLGKSYDSTGLGLAIVKKIIQDKKGEIWLKSEIGKGSTFFFKLPKT